jgi:hypothetical protein
LTKFLQQFIQVIEQDVLVGSLGIGLFFCSELGPAIDNNAEIRQKKLADFGMLLGTYDLGIDNGHFALTP